METPALAPGYRISTDLNEMDVDAVHAYLTRSYWSEGIPRDVVERSLRGSLCFGLFHGAAQVGFARVITDRGWLDHSRQIGTTGVVVDPRLYLAFGISGAVQHTAGLGQPDHIVSVNVDRHCPMMELADLAVVADANATLEELEGLLAPQVREAADG